jgi:hypothetical protein
VAVAPDDPQRQDREHDDREHSTVHTASRGSTRPPAIRRAVAAPLLKAGFGPPRSAATSTAGTGQHRRAKRRNLVLRRVRVGIAGEQRVVARRCGHVELRERRQGAHGRDGERRFVSILHGEHELRRAQVGKRDAERRVAAGGALQTASGQRVLLAVCVGAGERKRPVDEAGIDVDLDPVQPQRPRLGTSV